MALFEITLTDGVTERFVDAEAYQQEGPMTTFYRSDAGRGTLDAWATRIASFRSADVLMIQRRDGDGHGTARILDLVASDA